MKSMILVGCLAAAAMIPAAAMAAEECDWTKKIRDVSRIDGTTSVLTFRSNKEYKVEFEASCPALIGAKVVRLVRKSAQCIAAGDQIAAVNGVGSETRCAIKTATPAS